MRDDVLSLTALKYAAGAMDSVDEAAFEMKLADDPDAREALEEAVRLSAAALGQPAPAPDPLYRSLVIERLRPVTSWMSALVARRPYRGHPVTWSGAGASLTAVAAIAIWASMPNPQPTNCPNISKSNVLAITPPGAAVPVNPMATTGGGGGAETDVRTNRPSTFLPEHPMGSPIGPIGDG